MNEDRARNEEYKKLEQNIDTKTHDDDATLGVNFLAAMSHFADDINFSVNIKRASDGKKKSVVRLKNTHTRERENKIHFGNKFIHMGRYV
jgi:hypothetical protein